MLDEVTASILTKQADLVSLAIGAHQEFVAIHNMFIEVPEYSIALTFYGGKDKRTKQWLRPRVSRVR